MPSPPRRSRCSGAAAGSATPTLKRRIVLLTIGLDAARLLAAAAASRAAGPTPSS